MTVGGSLHNPKTDRQTQFARWPGLFVGGYLKRINIGALIDNPTSRFGQSANSGGATALRSCTVHTPRRCRASQGKTHAQFEFGVKVSMVLTRQFNLNVGARSF